MLSFAKYHGLGNDFIIFDASQPMPKSIPELCHRRTGIGADGLICLDKGNEADFLIHFYNADGSIASCCGNGLRCIVKYLVDYGIVEPYKKVSLEFSKQIFWGVDEKEKVKIFFPLPQNYRSLDQEIFYADTGVPHIVLFSSPDTKERAKELREYYNANINYVQKEENRYFVATYERGVEDFTLACGTGALAVALAIERREKKKFPITIDFSIGSLLIDKDDEHLIMVGEAKRSFTGKIDN